MAANDNHSIHQKAAAAPDSLGPRMDKLPAGRQHEPFIESLPFAGQFVIWAARAWVTALKLDQPYESICGDTFRRFDLSDAGHACDDFFGIVAQAALRQIDIRCVKCRFVSPDEVLFHNALAAAQSGQAFQSYSDLRQWLAPTPARGAFTTLLRIGDALQRAGLALSPHRTGATVRVDPLYSEVLAQTRH